jgi:hypothetical protein
MHMLLDFIICAYELQNARHIYLYVLVGLITGIYSKRIMYERIQERVLWIHPLSVLEISL